MKRYLKTGVMLAGAILSLCTLNACKKNQVSLIDNTRYRYDNMRSYSDLFNTFWQVMNDSYNYFYEQERRDGKTWDDVKAFYGPKFANLKTFGDRTINPDQYTDKDYANDADSALKYFEDIVDPIIDRHFSVDVNLYVAKNTVRSFRFRGGMKAKAQNPPDVYPTLNLLSSTPAVFGRTRYLLNNLFVNNTMALPETLNLLFGLQSPNHAEYMGGFLKSNPDVYYFAFSQFNMSQIGIIQQPDNYDFMKEQPNKPHFLTKETFANSPELAAIKDPVLKNKTLVYINNWYDKWHAILTSQELADFRAWAIRFKNDEKITDADNATITSMYIKIISAPSLSSYSGDRFIRDLTAYGSDGVAFVNWFSQKTRNYLNLNCNYPEFKVMLGYAYMSKNLFTKFYNPLHEGKIKKLIIDVRGNGGGFVDDFLNFTSRFITQKEVYEYQRYKEGNTPKDYTPWIPIHTPDPHKFGVPSKISMVVLTDRGSASMAEASTLVWKKAAGAKSVGDYSIGATSLLGFPDRANGGVNPVNGNIAGGFLNIYMPEVATKAADGTLVESTGIKPDYYVKPLNDAQKALLFRITPDPSIADSTLLKGIQVVNQNL